MEEISRSAPIGAQLDARRSEKYSLYERYLGAEAVQAARRFGADLTFVRGQGAQLFDREGNAYLDCDAGSGVFALGRNHPYMRQTMHDVIDLDLPNMVARDTPLLAGLLGEMLARYSPDELNKVIYTNSGSETIEASMKFARGLTGHPRFLYLNGDFHGLTYGAMSITDTRTHTRSGKGSFGPLLPGCTCIERNDVEQLRRELSTGDVAALIVEPIHGLEVRALSPEFISTAQELCKQHDTVLVADEVFLGLGRTGKMFACEHLGLDPDAMAISKALSGGYMPVGALLMRDSLHKRFFAQPGAVLHLSTFGHNDLGLAASLATLSIIEDEGLLANAQRQGARLMAGLRSLQQRYDLIADVRGWGLLVAVELQAPSSLHRRLSGRFLGRRGLLSHMVAMQLLGKYKIICPTSGRNNILRFHPPLTISAAEIDRLLDAMEAALQDIYRFPDGISRFLLGQLLRMARNR
jgi:ornithine--oxo-acid transaminase